MKLKNKISQAIALSVIFAASHASAFTNLLDFETVSGLVPIETMSISNQFQPQFGVSFRLLGGGSPIIARKGWPATAFTGGNNVPPFDSVNTNDPNYLAFGDFSLTDGEVNNVIIMDFIAPVAQASGYALDIDGGETATITAFSDYGTNELSRVVITNNSPGAGDNRGALWSFNIPTNAIRQIRFAVTGGSLGFAYDNFTSSYVPPPPQAATNSLRMYPGITISGEVGRQYQIEYTNNLSAGSWQLLTNFYLPSSPFLFFDVTATNAPRQFYQVIGLQ